MRRTLMIGISVTLAAIGDGCSKKPTESNPPRPPAVTATYPSSGETLADSLTGPITVSFTEAMNPASLTPATFWVDGKPGTVSYANGTASFKPTTPFAHNASYSAHLAASVTSQSGVPLGTAYTWSFTTRDWTFALLAMHSDTASPVEEGAQCVTACADGSYALAGWIGPYGSRGLLVSKVDSNGTPLWQRTHAVFSYAAALGIVETSDQGFAIAAQGGSSGADGILLKTDALGYAQWQNTYPYAPLYGVARAPDGNLLVSGGGSLFKIRATDGHQLWTGTTTGAVAGLCPGPNGSCLYTSTIPGDLSPATSTGAGRLDSAGQGVWYKELVHGHWDPSFVAATVVGTAAGNFVVLGGYTSGQPGYAYTGGTAVEVTPNGDSLWAYPDQLGYGPGPFTSGCRFQQGVLAFAPVYTSNGSSGDFTWFGSAGYLASFSEDWRAPDTRQMNWLFAGVARGADELVVVGEMTPDYNVSGKPRRLLFVRLRYM